MLLGNPLAIPWLGLYAFTAGGVGLTRGKAPWKKCYDQPRQHSEKQRHYFVNKGPSSQGYGFSSGHVWM